MTTKTFTAIDADGTILLSSRGKTGAAQKVIDALHAYRNTVASASGRLYGNPQSLGHIEVDGARAESLAGYFFADDLAA